MKKLFVIMLLIAVLLPVVALAESALPTEPFTWEQLATIMGATLATSLIVQLCKFPLDRVWKIPTRIVVYLISLIILELATQFTTGLTVNTGILNIFNAIIVALGAMGFYEISFSKIDEKRKE